ncbi:EamA domain-containing membrane protein RarD [Rubrivivax gelatinosus]|uniref:EamA domain-containing membrane protein RarD n=2 Tax=Rubrivivax gelatinosus TaxID=28068 RepID=A0A4R2MI58_RUBGE|nr:DMT family transporter [Rubrivivax gelatinosus]MBK1688677.1 permease [Rubrivivax gelatinosus]TCP04607.1 EamA domain-containing membrane protein RarD [Rubrivivax gelatinosus]
MIVATLMWSIAGVVTRHLEAARSFEVTFWRSAFNALALIALLSWLRGPAVLWRSIRGGGRTIWLSGVCWSVMYTAFMVGLTLTTVANVLVTMALGPLFTALLARFVLGHRLPARTWGAIAVAGGGIAWMYGQHLSAGDARHFAGTLVALAVPVAAAINWTTLQSRRDDPGADMLPAVLIGATLSALVTLPLAWPFQASAHDLGLLALLGSVQLAVPCLIAVAVARVLPAAEMSLLGLLEVIFGVSWAWLGAGEAPDSAVLAGGLLVLGALAANEWLGMRRRSPA